MMRRFSKLSIFNGVLARIPLPLIQVVLNYSINKIYNKYPSVFSKIAEEGNFSYLIVPKDLPFNFLLSVTAEEPSLTVESKDENLVADAKITANLSTLIAMLEGKLDGDAAFFSRELIIEGSTVAVVSLRNAIESENIDVARDLADGIPFVRKIIQKLITHSISYCNNKDCWQNNLINDIEESLYYHRQELKQLKDDIKHLKGDH